MTLSIRPGDLDDSGVIDLLRLHLEGMHAASPPGSVFALDLSGLRDPDVTFWTAHGEEKVVGCGALKALDPGHGEIKSMRVLPDHLGRGIGRAILDHIVAEARLRGYRRLSLETGSGPAFDAALDLYRRHGFVESAAFGGYAKSAFNRFLSLRL